MTKQPAGERGNVDKDEAEALKALAGYLMGLSQAALEKACNSGELTEVNCNAQNQIPHS